MEIEGKNNATLYGNTGGIETIIADNSCGDDNLKVPSTQATCRWMKFGDILHMLQAKGGQHELR